MKAAETRFEAELDVAEGRVRVVTLWRGEETGYGVLYFLDMDSADGTTDRRALLRPGADPDNLAPAQLAELFETARPLTETERRFPAGDERPWLAQNRGPVWAGRSAAEGHTGILFTSLTGKRESYSIPAGHVGEMSVTELEAQRREAVLAAERAAVTDPAG